MARKFLVNLDLNGNQVLNFRAQNLASAPGSPGLGQFYYDTATNKMYYRNNSAWIAADGSTLMTTDTPAASAVGDVAAVGTATTWARADHKHAREAFGAVTAQTAFGASSGNGVATSVARSDHTHGTPAHNDAAHSAVKLSALAVPDASVSFNSQKITNLGTPTADADAATKAYVDAARAGLDVKDSVRAATTANITLSGTQTIDGVSVVANDRVLVKDQTTGANNGIYVAAAGAWSRATDADTSAEVTPGMFVFVEEGTANGDKQFVLTTNAPITLGTTSLGFTQYGGASGVTPGAGLVQNGSAFDVVSNHAFLVVNADNIDIGTLPVNKGGTGATDAAGARTNLSATGKFTTSTHASATSVAITHNLNTTAVVVSTVQVSDGVIVDCDVTVTDANTVTFGFATAPTANSIRFTVIG